MTEDDYAALASRVAGFAASLASAIAEGGLAVAVPVVGPLVGLFLGPGPDAHCSSRRSTT